MPSDSNTNDENRDETEANRANSNADAEMSVDTDVNPDTAIDEQEPDRLTSESRPDHVTDPITPTSDDMADPPAEHRNDQTADGQAQSQDEGNVTVDFNDLSEEEQRTVIESTKARDQQSAPGETEVSEEFLNTLSEENRRKFEQAAEENQAEGEPNTPDETAANTNTGDTQQSNTPGEASVRNSDPNVTEVAAPGDSANTADQSQSQAQAQSQNQDSSESQAQDQSQEQEQDEERELATQEEVEEARRKRAEQEEDESPPKETGRFASLKQPAEDYYIKVRGEKFRVSDPAERGEDASMDEIASDLQTHLRDHIEEHGQVDTSKMNDEELDDLLYSMVSLVVEEEIPRADWDEFYDGPKTALANGVMQYVQNHVSGFTLQRANGERPGARG